MTPLILDAGAKASLKKMVDYAKANVYRYDNMDTEHIVPGNHAGHVTILPFGYKVVFSIEERMPGKIYHLTMSVNTPGKLPNPAIVEALMKEVGFKNEMHDCLLNFEEIGPDHHAISVVEVHEPNEQQCE